MNRSEKGCALLKMGEYVKPNRRNQIDRVAAAREGMVR
jgi:hypothetical protein